MPWVNALGLSGVEVEWMNYDGEWASLTTSPPAPSDGVVTVTETEIQVSNPNFQFAGPWGVRVVLPEDTAYSGRRVTLTAFDTGGGPAVAYPSASCGSFVQAHALNQMPVLNPNLEYTDIDGLAELANVSNPVMEVIETNPIVGDRACVGAVIIAVVD